MLHLKTLMSQTPGNIVRNSRRVKISDVNAVIDDDDKGRHKFFTCIARANDGPRHVVMKLYARYPKGNMKAAVPAWVQV